VLHQQKRCIGAVLSDQCRARPAIFSDNSPHAGLVVARHLVQLRQERFDWFVGTSFDRFVEDRSPAQHQYRRARKKQIPFSFSPAGWQTHAALVGFGGNVLEIAAAV